MAIGTVKFFDPAKGFGFIQPESGEKDVFVHVSAVQNAGMDTLSEGQRVSYDVNIDIYRRLGNIADGEAMPSTFE